MAETLHIRNMVCGRCITAVQSVFDKLELPVRSLSLGEVELETNLTEEQRELVKADLEQLGFEVISNKREQLVTAIKAEIIELIHHKKEQLSINLSDYLVEHLKVDYFSMSKIFSETEGTTIEKFVIAQKIERAKELISYNELTLSEIAEELHYSSVAHLSAQFKKVSGCTPSQFKNDGCKDRKSLSDL